MKKEKKNNPNKRNGKIISNTGKELAAKFNLVSQLRKSLQHKQENKISCKALDGHLTQQLFSKYCSRG